MTDDTTATPAHDLCTWIDAPDGRIGQALQQTCIGAHLTDQLSKAQFVVAARIFGSDDAQAAMDRANEHGFAGRWVLISSLAERRYERWRLPEPRQWADEPWPEDEYGVGKRRGRELLERNAPGKVTTLLLPALLARDDRRRHWASLAEQVDTLGHAWTPGSGGQRSGLVTPADIARIIAAVVTTDGSIEPVLQVGPPAPAVVSDLIEAYLTGAGRAVKWRPHPDANHRQPLSPADETCDASALHAAFATLCWDDPELVCLEMGKLLANDQ